MQPQFTVETRRVGGVTDSHTVVTTQSEAIISGPGKLYVQMSHYELLRMGGANYGGPLFREN